MVSKTPCKIWGVYADGQRMNSQISTSRSQLLLCYNYITISQKYSPNSLCIKILNFGGEILTVESFFYSVIISSIQIKIFLMDSIYFTIGILILMVGFFLAVALSIHFCACVQTRRRIQREKARLQEIRIAAAQSPPPYALVVAECHLNHNRESNEQQHQNPNCQRHRNFCSLPRTCRQNKVISSGYVLPATHNSLSSAHYSQYYANNSLTTGEATSDTISEVNELRSGMSNEPPPPSYEDALKREMVMTESLNRL